MSKKFFLEYFNFSTKEKNGLIILFIILFSVITTNIIIKNQKKQVAVDFTEFESEIDKFIYSGKIDESEIELSYFDPNAATKDELEKLGLPHNVVNNIINYRNRGGQFFNAESFRRIYGLSDEEFNRVKDYIAIENQRKSSRFSQRDRKTAEKTELFYFDPNTANKEELQKLGLRDWQANNIIRYRESGGSFSVPEDLARIYGLDDKIFNELKAYIKIEKTEESEDTEVSIAPVIVEINSANAYELQKIRGIGPAFSERIIEYREKLGGFHDKSQLLEVWGIEEDILESISEYIEINADNIKKINLNTAEYRDLISHPYIDRKTTNTLLEYKRFAGKINNLEDLLQQKAINQDIYDKINRYLSVE